MNNIKIEIFFAPALTQEQIKTATENFAWSCDQFEAKLTEHEDKHFFGGEKLNIGDIALTALLHSIVYNDGINDKNLGESLKHAFESRPHLKAWHERTSAHFADYFAHRPAPRNL